MFLTFGPLLQQLFGNLYLYPYLPWYILPPPIDIFFVGTRTFFRILQLGSGKISNSLGTVCIEGPNFNFWEIVGLGDRSFSSIKPSMTNHVNSRIVDGKIMFHVCTLTFLTFTWEFSVWEFSVCSSFHWNSQKSVYYCFVITLKVWVLFDMSAE